MPEANDFLGGGWARVGAGISPDGCLEVRRGNGILSRVCILAAEDSGRRNVVVVLRGRWDATAAVYALGIATLDAALLVSIGPGPSGHGSAALDIMVMVVWIGACLTAGFRKTPWAIRLTAIVLLIMLVVSTGVFVGHDAVDAFASMGLVAAVEVVGVLLGRAARWAVLAFR